MEDEARLLECSSSEPWKRHPNLSINNETKQTNFPKSISFPDLRRYSVSQFGTAALSAEAENISIENCADEHAVSLASANGMQMEQKPYILVTGGCGFIGSHTVVELLHKGYNVVIVDNLDNSSQTVIPRIQQITGRAPRFLKIDLCDKTALMSIFQAYSIHSVLHLASLKSVGESVAQPIKYYVNNIQSTLNLIEVMEMFNVRNLVFSSSATVYGQPERLPLTEDCRLSVTNPYGRTKLHAEEILRDLHFADKRWNIVILRYFNPVGAHPSGLIGEDPCGVPNNLMPFVAQVATGRREFVNIFGNDYHTNDGTGVRDYLHVVDLALGHVAALEKMKDAAGLKTYNLGTGCGYSVLDVIREMSLVSNIQIPYKVTTRRPGDVASAYCDPSLAEKELNWKATRDLRTMCRDVWNWQTRNPRGYDG